MKAPLRSLLESIFLVLILSFSVQAAPLMGTWTAPEDFDPGTWEEILWGGGEGQTGNEITAASTGFYKFKGAKLMKDGVEVVDPSSCGSPAKKYKTVYLGGTLELTNSNGVPWLQNGDPNPYVISLQRSEVETCKYLDVPDGNPTGKISFILNSEGSFPIQSYPNYAVSIRAEFFEGFPNQGGTGTEADPLTISGDLNSAQITITGPVAVDIKPGSCPNPINTKSQGVLPVTILGGSNLDVRDIDPLSIKLAKVSPLRWAYEDVGTPFNPLISKTDRMDCNAAGFDGFPDLTLKFDTQALVESLGLTDAPDRSTQVLTLEFKLKDGTSLSGSDVVWILNKTRNGNNGNHFGGRK